MNKRVKRTILEVFEKYRGWYSNKTYMSLQTECGSFFACEEVYPCDYRCIGVVDDENDIVEGRVEREGKGAREGWMGGGS
jgi:hypothetical protein